MIKPVRFKVYDLDDKDSFVVRNVVTDQNIINCDIYPFGAMENADLYFALYENDKLKKVDINSVAYTEEKVSVSFEADIAPSDKFKIFAWGENTNVPLMRASEYDNLLYKED